MADGDEEEEEEEEVKERPNSCVSAIGFLHLSSVEGFLCVCESVCKRVSL